MNTYKKCVNKKQNNKFIYIFMFLDVQVKEFHHSVIVFGINLDIVTRKCIYLPLKYIPQKLLIWHRWRIRHFSTHECYRQEKTTKYIGPNYKRIENLWLLLMWTPKIMIWFRRKWKCQKCVIYDRNRFRLFLFIIFTCCYNCTTN